MLFNTDGTISYLFTEHDFSSAWESKLQELRLRVNQTSRNIACSYINRRLELNQASLNKIARDHCSGERRISPKRSVTKFNYAIFRFLTS